MLKRLLRCWALESSPIARVKNISTQTVQTVNLPTPSPKKEKKYLINTNKKKKKKVIRFTKMKIKTPNKPGMFR